MGIATARRIANWVRCYQCLLVAWSWQLSIAASSKWDHIMDFDQNYRLLWTSTGQDITFEIQSRTQGFVGLGFSRDGTLADSDIVVGWMDDGQTRFQVSFI
ncbi:hypothetical protein RP20_CCG018054 [Aedes albopictus]|nr:hypothetical protein RP20_CCG018054 [Aedes albopictus]